MKDNLDKEFLIKIIELAQFGSKRVIGDIFKDKIKENIEKDKLSKLSQDISNYIFEEDVKERIRDYIEKDIYTNAKDISILSEYHKNDFIENFFKKYTNCIMYRKDIEKIFEEYLKKLEDYEKSLLSKNDNIIIKKINEVDKNNRKDNIRIEKTIKETEEKVIKEIRKKDKLGMISIEEKQKIEFEVLNVDDYDADALYGYFGNTVAFADINKSGSKLLMKISIKNVGTDFLYNIAVNGFEIFAIQEFDHDSYAGIDICSKIDNKIIKNTILPGTSSQLYFIFDPFEIDCEFGDDIFENFTNKLSIRFTFDIKSGNGKTIKQEFQIYCSVIEGKEVGNEYLIDSVTNIFEINED